MNTTFVKTLRNPKTAITALLISLSVILTSCGSGTSGKNFNIPGVDGPNVVLLGDDILINVVFENMTIEGGARYAIPKYPNSYVEIAPDLESEGTLMAFSVSLDDIFGDSVKRLDPLTLPGGRAIPGVSSGTLPAVAFSIEKFKNVAFYIGPQIFGVWIPLKKLNMPGAMITTRFYTGSKRVGNLSLVGEDANGENAGFFLALTVSSYQERLLKRQAKRY
ncbi:hypothetical protein [Bacteriovorax sp. DB6_IX]|uniref:hypothetical protein n=1 Tax=Bacteriovorax sp. DB6_IX TaxID=1353530 RepID=UPI00038A01F4|nr:hypothetical protein [Bacteriovorax sp. DB6_IX]EQC43109.1 putative lipoprotein [Bacteriovorax sp. DB6_IX]